ncbi:MAG: anthranilate synthase component I family protein [Verrucomicrobiota bacterium]
MSPLLVQSLTCATSPELLAQRLPAGSGAVLLRSSLFEGTSARYSFVAVNPIAVFQSFGARCETHRAGSTVAEIQYGSPWQVLDALLAKFEVLDEPDLPFPLGGCFGYWGYDLRHFVEPKLARKRQDDLELPDCHLGFYDSLVAFDHHLGQAWIIATGLAPDGSRELSRAAAQLEFWKRRISAAEAAAEPPRESLSGPAPDIAWHSNFTKPGFVAAVRRAQQYIRAGDIYQVNLAQRITVDLPGAPRGWDDRRPRVGSLDGWRVYERLTAVSPAPFSAFLDCNRFQLASSSPELFLRLSGRQIQTRPIKGTRPRSADPTRDAQLAYELRTSSKEMAELVMITDLLRNDLGRVCEFGSVHVPDLARLERFAQVQHLVSTVEGRLRPDVTHGAALSACFPGGSVTGAPKFRAQQIIDELEPVCRGPYTGALGYLGFNRESQLSITIRSAVCLDGRAHYHAGAGIVADSHPESEYDETIAKARGFLLALGNMNAAKPAGR